MAAGFNEDDFTKIVGWELYQVTLDKYHVTFWFENGWALLNVANKFSHRSADGSVAYDYEIYGQAKRLELDRILRVVVEQIIVASERCLDLRFANGDVLTIHDDPNIRSWWFYRYDNNAGMNAPLLWAISDADI